MKKTIVFIIAVILLIVAYDFYIISAEGKGASVSATIIRWSYSYPSFTFSMGFVFGHLFWKMRDSDVWKRSKK